MQDRKKIDLKLLDKKAKFFIFSWLFLVILIFQPVQCFNGDNKDIYLTQKNLMEEIKGLEKPVRSKELKQIKITALKGEYEPFTFSIYSKSDCKLVSITPTGLKKIDDAYHEINAQHIEVHLLKNGQTPRYKVNDWLLSPLAEYSITADKSVRVWLTVHVPESSFPGNYTGMLKMHFDNGQPIQVPIHLCVLPQMLEDPPGVQFAVLYTVSPFGQRYRPDKFFRLKSEVLDFYKELRAHGMSSASPKTSDWPYKKGNIEGLKAELRLAGEAGLDGPVLWYMSALINGAKGGKKYAHYDGKCDNWNESRDLANLKEIVKITKEVEKKEGWPEVVFITVDEAGSNTEDRTINNLRMKILEKSLKVVSDLGYRGATTVSELVDDRHNKPPFSLRPNDLRRFWDGVRPFCQIRIYNYGFPQGPTNLFHEMRDAKKRGHEVWFYLNKATMRTNRYLARTYFGIWGWKIKADGLTSWTYPGARTVQWEIVREGIDDFKYLKLIERLINTDNVDQKVRNNASAFLNDVSRSLKLDKNGFTKKWKPKIDPVIFRTRALEIIDHISNP